MSDDRVAEPRESGETSSMYASYWGLTTSPFENQLDINWYFETPGHEEALARLFYVVEQQRRCGLLTGPTGCGKSFLLRVLDYHVRRSQRRSAVIDLTGLDANEILWQLAARLQVGLYRDDSRALIWRALEDDLRSRELARAHTVLLFDNFQDLDREGGRLIDRLLHLGERHCSLTVVLSGSDAAVSTLSQATSGLCDLRIDLPPFTPEETAGYVSGQLAAAGAPDDLFTREALRAVSDHSWGIVRQINRLCDLSLLAGMGDELQRSEADVVHAAACELGLTDGMSPVPPRDLPRPVVVAEEMYTSRA